MRKDIFISYAKDDRAAADQVCSQLEEAGIGCWIAPRDIAPGVTWPAAITEAIRNCRAMVVIFSENANKSPHMAREVEVADSRHVPILPVRFQEVEPAGDMEYFLGNRQWFDLHGGKVERRRSLPDAIASLLRDQADPMTAAPATPSVPPAKTGVPKWTIGLAAVVVIAGGIWAYRVTSQVPSAPPDSKAPQTGTTQVESPPAVQTPPLAVEPPIAPKSKPAAKQAPTEVAKVTPPATKPSADFAGRWQAQVKYNWGSVHNETFQFKLDDKEVYGTASYVGTARGILDGKIDGAKISFMTKSQTMLGDKTYEEKHSYKGRLTPDGIDFVLQTDSGYDSRTPEMFTARRIP